MLGEFLEENCPDVSVKFVIKHEKEWHDFIDATCRSFGFYEKTCPIVYTIEGTLIGDGANFVEHVRDRYGKVLGMTKENQKRRTNKNVEMIQDEMRKKKDGLTLSEKIEKAIEKVKKKENVSHMNDTFYEEVVDRGVVFYLRKTNLQREDGRLKNVVDKIEVEQKAKVEAEAIEAARDMTYEEFKDKYVSHIEGTATNERADAGDSDDDEKPEAGSKLK